VQGLGGNLSFTSHHCLRVGSAEAGKYKTLSYAVETSSQLPNGLAWTQPWIKV